MRSAVSRTTFANVIPQPMTHDSDYGDLLYVLGDARHTIPATADHDPGAVTRTPSLTPARTVVASATPARRRWRERERLELAYLPW